MSNEASTYARLQREVMASLRTAHADWTEDVFAAYEARFQQLVRTWIARGEQTTG